MKPGGQIISIGDLVFAEQPLLARMNGGLQSWFRPRTGRQRVNAANGYQQFTDNEFQLSFIRRLVFDDALGRARDVRGGSAYPRRSSKCNK